MPVAVEVVVAALAISSSKCIVGWCTIVICSSRGSSSTTTTTKERHSRAAAAGGGGGGGGKELTHFHWNPWPLGTGMLPWNSCMPGAPGISQHREERKRDLPLATVLAECHQAGVGASAAEALPVQLRKQSHRVRPEVSRTRAESRVTGFGFKVYLQLTVSQCLHLLQAILPAIGSCKCTRTRDVGHTVELQTMECQGVGTHQSLPPARSLPKLGDGIIKCNDNAFHALLGHILQQPQCPLCVFRTCRDERSAGQAIWLKASFLDLLEKGQGKLPLTTSFTCTHGRRDGHHV